MEHKFHHVKFPINFCADCGKRLIFKAVRCSLCGKYFHVSCSLNSKTLCAKKKIYRSRIRLFSKSDISSHLIPRAAVNLHSLYDVSSESLLDVEHLNESIQNLHSTSKKFNTLSAPIKTLKISSPGLNHFGSFDSFHIQTSQATQIKHTSYNHAINNNSSAKIGDCESSRRFSSNTEPSTSFFGNSQTGRPFENGAYKEIKEEQNFRVKFCEIMDNVSEDEGVFELNSDEEAITHLRQASRFNDPTSHQTWPLQLPRMSIDATPELSMSNAYRLKSFLAHDSAQEWLIDKSEIVFLEDIIQGRNSVTSRGIFHGSVYITTRKFVPNRAIEADLKELCSIRHEAFALFMGYALHGDKISFITGMADSELESISLHRKIHILKHRLDIKKIVYIAKQIVLAIGYLHAKCYSMQGRLTSKNIIVNRSLKIKLSLFDLSQYDQLERIGCGSLPKGYLLYLPPELLQTAHVLPPDVKFSAIYKSSMDIWAIGTLLYELLRGQWPYKNVSSHSLIYRIGTKGAFQRLEDFYCCAHYSKMLRKCWQFNEEYRPTCAELADELENEIKLHKTRCNSAPTNFDSSANMPVLTSCKTSFMN